MMKPAFIFLSMLGLALLPSCSSVPAKPLADVPPGGTATVMRVHRGLPVVPVTVGGRVATFIVDTGANSALVSARIVAQLGLPAQKKKAMVMGFDGFLGFRPTVIVPRLNVGGARFFDVPAVVVEEGPLGRQFGAGIEGILPFTLFEKARFTLDYPHNQLRIEPSSRPLPRGSAVPLGVRDGCPTLPATIGRTTVECEVDTGYSGSLVLDAPGLGIASTPVGKPVKFYQMGGKKSEVQLRRLDADLTVGGAILARQPLVESRPAAPPVIGTQALKQCCVTFDQVRKTAVLEPVEARVKP